MPTAGAGQTVAAVLALDAPAPPVGVGGLHVGAQVSAGADTGRVPAAVTVRQFAYRALEPGVVQCVQRGQAVAQALGAGRFPPGPFPLSAKQESSGEQDEGAEGDQDPPGPAAS